MCAQSPGTVLLMAQGTCGLEKKSVENTAHVTNTVSLCVFSFSFLFQSHDLFRPVGDKMRSHDAQIGK